MKLLALMVAADTVMSAVPLRSRISSVVESGLTQKATDFTVCPVVPTST